MASIFGNMAFPELLIVLVIGVVFVIPAARILGRTGHSPWLAILALFPLLNLILLWYIAFARWPAVERTL